MFGRAISAACCAAVFGVFGWASSATAQVAASAGCNAINGGVFNQAPASGIGVTIAQTFELNAGETITVTITNATNSLAVVGANVIFAGDVGSLSRSLTIIATGNFFIQSDIQGAGSSIAWSCAAGNNGGGGDAEAAEVQNEEATGANVNKGAQISTQAGALPSTLGLVETAPQRTLQNEVEDHRQFLLETLVPARDATIVLLRDKFLPLLVGDTSEGADKVRAFYQTMLFRLEDAGGDPVEILDAFSAIASILYVERPKPIPVDLSKRLFGLVTVAAADIYDALGLADPQSIRDEGKSSRELDIDSVYRVLTDYKDRLKKLEETETEKSFGHGEGEQILFSSGGPGQVTFAIDSDMLFDLGNLASLGENGVNLSTAPRDYKFWARGRITVLDGNRNGVDGEAGEVMFGVVSKINQRAEVGAFAGFFSSDLTTNTLGMDIETSALKLGLYGNMLIGDGLRAGLSGSYQRGDVDTARGAATSDYGFDAFDLSASLSGAFAMESWVVSPSVSATLSHRSDDAHTDSGGLFVAAENRTDGTLTGAFTVSRTFQMETGMLRSFTPNFLVSGNVFLTDRGETDAEYFALSTGAGGSFGFENGAFLTATTFISGFTQDTQGYGAQLKFTVPF